MKKYTKPSITLTPVTSGTSVCGLQSGNYNAANIKKSTASNVINY